MSAQKPRSIAIYRRGLAWVDGRELGTQPTLLDHGRFLAALERSGQAIHAGPAHRLNDVPASGPIGLVSFPCDPDDVQALLRDDPGLLSGLLCSHRRLATAAQAQATAARQAARRSASAHICETLPPWLDWQRAAPRLPT